MSDPYLRLGDVAKQVEADKVVYEAALKKARSKSTRSPADGPSPLEQKTADARRDYENSMLLYVGRLTETMNHLRAEFLDRLTSCMFAAVRPPRFYLLQAHLAVAPPAGIIFHRWQRHHEGSHAHHD